MAQTGAERQTAHRQRRKAAAEALAGMPALAQDAKRALLWLDSSRSDLARPLLVQLAAALDALAQGQQAATST